MSLTRSTRLSRAIACTFLCGTLCLPARADEQADRIKALETRLEQSLRLIEKLAERLAELERNAKTPPAKPQADDASSRAAQAQEMLRLQDSVNQISAGLGQRDNDSGLPLHGFADVGAAWSAGADSARWICT
jgi:hypothetical protein